MCFKFHNKITTTAANNKTLIIITKSAKQNSVIIDIICSLATPALVYQRWMSLVCNACPMVLRNNKRNCLRISPIRLYYHTYDDSWLAATLIHSIFVWCMRHHTSQLDCLLACLHYLPSTDSAKRNSIKTNKNSIEAINKREKKQQKSSNKQKITKR